MNKFIIELSDLEKKRIWIGYEGEQNHTMVIIRCGAFFAKYPEASAYMTVKTPTSLIYPVALDRDENDLIWNVTRADVSIVGSGKLQLTFTNGTGDDAEIIKSVNGDYEVLDSLDPNGEAPDPVQNWIENAEQTAQEIAENAANLAKEDIVESYGSIAPAIIETASGAIASFSDGADGMLVKTLTVDINPVQDLHGYDNPWPGGGGKNLYDFESVFNDTTKFTISGNSATGAAKDISGASFHVPSSMIGKTVTFSAELTVGSDTTYMRARVSFADTTYSNGNSVQSGNTGTSVLTFTPTSTDDVVYIAYGSGQNGINTVSKFQLEVGESPTAYAPYENNCPISGWTEANVTATGKSLITCTTAFSGTSRNITFSGNGNDINMTGTASGTNCDTPQMDIGSFEFKKNVTYIFSLIGAKTSNDVYARVKGDGDWIWLGSRTTYDNDRYKTVFSFDSDTYVNSMRVRFYTAQGTTATVNYKWQIEVAEASASFVPFVDSDTYTYPFPQSAGTVYGGTLTIRQDGTGTLLVNRAEDDLGARNWTVSADNISFLSSARPSGDIIPSSQSEMPKVICDIYRPSPIIDQLDMSIAIATSGKFKIRDSRFPQPLDASAFKTAMNGIKAVYELAEPVSYDLTAQQVVSLLKGTNNVWADTGDVDLEYPADTKIYIDARVAELQALILENISNS